MSKPAALPKPMKEESFLEHAEEFFPNKWADFQPKGINGSGVGLGKLIIAASVCFALFSPGVVLALTAPECPSGCASTTAKKTGLLPALGTGTFRSSFACFLIHWMLFSLFITFLYYGFLNKQNVACVPMAQLEAIPAAAKGPSPVAEPPRLPTVGRYPLQQNPVSYSASRVAMPYPAPPAYSYAK